MSATNLGKASLVVVLLCAGACPRTGTTPTEPDASVASCDGCGAGSVCVDNDHCADTCPDDRSECRTGPAGIRACCPAGSRCCADSADLCVPAEEACPIACSSGAGACPIGQF